MKLLLIVFFSLFHSNLFIQLVGLLNPMFSVRKFVLYDHACSGQIFVIYETAFKVQQNFVIASHNGTAVDNTVVLITINITV